MIIYFAKKIKSKLYNKFLVVGISRNMILHKQSIKLLQQKTFMIFLYELY